MCLRHYILLYLKFEYGLIIIFLLYNRVLPNPFVSAIVPKAASFCIASLADKPGALKRVLTSCQMFDYFILLFIKCRIDEAHNKYKA